MGDNFIDSLIFFYVQSLKKLHKYKPVYTNDIKYFE